MKKASKSFHNLSLFANGPVTEEAGSAENLTRMDYEVKPASHEKPHQGDAGFCVQESKISDVKDAGLGFGAQNIFNTQDSRSLFDEDDSDFPPLSQDDGFGPATNQTAVDPNLSVFNLDPSMVAVQIDWRYKKGVKKPVYHSLAGAIRNYIPFSDPVPKGYLKHPTEIDEIYFNNPRMGQGKAWRMPKEEPIPPNRIFTAEEEKIIERVNAREEFDTIEELEAAAALHTDYVLNLINDKRAENRRLGRKPWMIFYYDEDGNKIGVDLYKAYAKEHPTAFNQLHHVWHRNEEIYYNPKITFCHTLDDRTDVPW